MFQRHPIQSDAFFFVTTNTKDRRPIFGNPAYAREAIDTLYRVQEIHPFFLYGFVFMPDHCHLLLHVPAPESISGIMRVFKYGCTVNMGIGAFWQSRFHLRISHDAKAVLRYIHQNPVRAGLVREPEQFPWSSASGRWDVTEIGWWQE